MDRKQASRIVILAAGIVLATLACVAVGLILERSMSSGVDATAVSGTVSRS